MENNNEKYLPEENSEIEEMTSEESVLEEEADDDEEVYELPTTQKLCSFEFNVKNEEEDKAFLFFQKKYVYKKNWIKTAGFGILAVGFAISAYRDPSMAVNYMLMGVSLAAIAAIWYNTKKVRQSLMEALKMLEDDRYIFSLYEDCFVIETIISEEEKSEEGFVPIKPNIEKLSDENLDITEHDDMFVIIVKKETIFVLPKRCMNEEQIKMLSEKLVNNENKPE